MSQLGIMQGRLVPPTNNRIQAFPCDQWRDEFANAAEAKLDCIEWIYETFGENSNPLTSDDGIAELLDYQQKYGVAVQSLCADYFMEFPLVRATEAELAERVERLGWVINQSYKVGIKRIVVPCVDNSAIRTEEDKVTLIHALEQVFPDLERCQVELHLETSLNPADFKDLLSRIPHPQIKANYDSGNSASLGYKAEEEFAAYGDRIGSVHIKDRVLNGGTVPLGQGDADLLAVFNSLRKIDYRGDFILQVARAESGDEVSWAKQNRAYVINFWPELGK